jgi:hypothetical protein
MAHEIRLTPTDEQCIGTYDEDENGLEYIADGPAPSMATGGNLPEDPMPLFLSNDGEISEDDEAYRRRGFGTGGARNTALWPQILKAGIFVTSAAAIAFAVISVENPLALFANAKASLIGSSPDQARAVPPLQPIAALQLVSNNRPTSIIATPIGERTPPATVTPTRDDIAVALRAARQSQLEIVQPPAAPPKVAAAPARRMDADQLAALLKRARSLIEIGDIAPARLLLERAADAQEARAALLLAQTYDPAVLGAQDMRSITPDPAMARDWYQKAARFGSLDAKQRLAQMQD